MFVKNNRFLIKTPYGYEKFDGILTKTTDKLYKIEFSDGSCIKCSAKHALLSSSGFKFSQDIRVSDDITGKTVVSISVDHGNFTVFDPVGVKDHASYYSNNVISHNTEFLGSTNTLISSSKLDSLRAGWRNPAFIELDGLFKVYEYPAQGRKYAITVDPSEGQNKDYSAISVFDVSEAPYKQVALYRNNKISPYLFPTVIYTIATKYNDAFILVEINSIGLQISDILHYELGYDNLVKIETKQKHAQSVSSGHKKGQRMGLKTSVATKRIGCTNLKGLLESDKLLVWDKLTIAELFTFTSNHQSFAADAGRNDDLVMTLVLFAWLISQKYFKDMIQVDIRKIIQDEELDMMDSDIVPVGVITDGREEEYTVDTEGNVWRDVDDWAGNPWESNPFDMTGSFRNRL